MNNTRESDVWDDYCEGKTIVPRRPARGPGGKPSCFGCYGSMSYCKENENGVVPCPWANLCVDPDYPRRYD